MTLCFGTAAILNWENLNSKNSRNIHHCKSRNTCFYLWIVLLFLEKKKKKADSITINISKIFLSRTTHEYRYLFGLLFSFLGLEITNPIISGVLFLASPLTTILFSAYFFKEKIKVTDWIAIGVIAFGAFLLHLQTT